MRASLLVLVFLVGCGPTAEELQRDAEARGQCGDNPDCLVTDYQDLAVYCKASCLAVRSCCSCLAELDCNMPSEEQCVKNLDNGGTITARAECSRDDGLCGRVCGLAE
jgi:hypothetical protein